ncbi:hypothetical protein [Micromonospora sp. NPDC093244]|uniref:hypothetical protein n=1 Tax=Micromonospora sp. NPDC093244 TaxID=3155071 RepID=UPI00342A3D97
MPNPADGRSLLLELTPQGAEVVDDAEDTFQEHLATHIGLSIAPAQIAELGRTLTRLRATMERGGVGTPVG